MSEVVEGRTGGDSATAGRGVADGEMDLSEVIGQGPAAVLVVDLATRQVVHANPVAEQLAPGKVLPMGLDAWSDAAQLRDRDGAELSVTEHPLSRVARSEPVAGQAVSAARRSEMGVRREPLWVVAVPMSGAPMLDEHALIVLLPLRGEGAGRLVSARMAAALDDFDDVAAPDDPRVGGQTAGLSERAVLATGLSFTVADAREKDQPLVWVNPAFTAVTGYELDDVLGRNCRFLQGRATDRAEVARIRAALDAGEGITTSLLNYRKDGVPFWNQVDISPVHGADGEVTHFVGIQTDVSDRVDSDHARDRALEAERVARADAEAAQARLRFLVEAINTLTGTLDVAEMRRRLIDLVLPELADWVLVLHRQGEGMIAGVAAAHRDPARQALVEELAERLPGGLHDGSLEELFLPEGQVRRIANLDRPESQPERRSYLRDSSLTEYTARLDGRSAMFVALPGRGRVSDLMILVRGPQREQFTDADLEVGLDLGRRVGLILDNARLFEVQSRIAETLQRSLLPALPVVEGITVAARYQASEIGAEVGGDFYELLDLPGASFGFAVGDVAGHDVLAAAAMGHLKGLLRACAYETSSTPAVVLQRVDTLIAGLGMPTIATAVYAQLTPADGSWLLVWSNAGHPPLVVRYPDGSVELLVADSGSEVLLGLDSGTRSVSTRDLPTGTTIIGYTDGLIERRSEVIDEGLQRLVRTVADGPDDVDELCDYLLAHMSEDAGHGDDVAVIAMCLGEPQHRAS